MNKSKLRDIKGRELSQDQFVAVGNFTTEKLNDHILVCLEMNLQTRLPLEQSHSGGYADEEKVENQLGKREFPSDNKT